MKENGPERMKLIVPWYLWYVWKNQNFPGFSWDFLLISVYDWRDHEAAFITICKNRSDTFLLLFSVFYLRISKKLAGLSLSA